MMFDKCDRLNEFAVWIFNYGFNKRVLMYVCMYVRDFVLFIANTEMEQRVGEQK